VLTSRIDNLDHRQPSGGGQPGTDLFLCRTSSRGREPAQSVELGIARPFAPGDEMASTK